MFRPGKKNGQKGGQMHFGTTGFEMWTKERTDLVYGLKEIYASRSKTDVVTPANNVMSCSC